MYVLAATVFVYLHTKSNLRYERSPSNMISESQGGGGFGTLIFSYIRRLGPFFGVQNFEFQYFFGFLEKLIFFGV